MASPTGTVEWDSSPSCPSSRPDAAYALWRDAELVADVPGERISWRSLPGADVDTSGTVRFLPAPGGRGTEVHLELRYAAPAGRPGMLLAKLLGREPTQQAKTICAASSR